MIVYIYNIGVDLYNGFNGLRHRINWTYFTVLDGLAHPLYSEKNRLYKDHPKGFYVYAKFKSTDNDSNDTSANKNSKDIQGCVNYFIRYAARPHG